MALAPSLPLMRDSLQEGPVLFAASVRTDRDTLRFRMGLVSNFSLQMGHWGPILDLLLMSQWVLMHV